MERIWLKHYPTGIPSSVDVTQYTTLVDFIARLAERYGDRPAFESFDTRLTYQQIHEVSTQFAAFLQDKMKVQMGDRCAVMMPNLISYPIALFGVLKAGGVVVNMNPLYKPREISLILNDAKVKVVIVLDRFMKHLVKALPYTATKQVIVVRLGDLIPGWRGKLLNGFSWWSSFSLRHIKWSKVRFNSALQKGRSCSFDPPVIFPEEMAMLQYTGGTTGAPKGAMLCHRNIVANVLQCDAWFRPILDGAEGRLLLALPLYHIFSFTVSLIFMSLGSCASLVIDPRDLQGLVKRWQKIRPSAFIGVNTLFNALLSAPEFSTINFSNLRLNVAGGMALQKSVALKWQAVTGVPIVEGYGLTECSPVVAVNPLNIKDYNGSIGLPLPNTEISIRGEDGQELSLHDIGELWVRGPQVMQGYWQRPEETHHTITAEGWLKTGDLARVDEEGFVYLVDRKKDMINVSGFNVYPNEVEDVIMCHPDVKEVVVISVPDVHSGEAVKAFVVRKNTHLTDHALTKFCRERLTGYKVPKFIEFRESLPKSYVGKVLRRALQDEAQAH